MLLQLRLALTGINLGAFVLFQKNKYHVRRTRQYFPAFTIIELLVVIVLIGVLATIIFVAYGALVDRAKIATIKADLANSAKQLELFKTGSVGSNYPSTLDCLQPDSATNLCLKSSGTNVYTYTVSNTADPKTFRLAIKNDGLNYYVTSDSSSPIVITSPVLNTPTAGTIAATSATLGATISADGGDDMTAYGICWGTTPNPTTNCSEIEQGSLTALSPATRSTTTFPMNIEITPDGNDAFAIRGDGIVLIYGRDGSTGLLTQTSTFDTGAYSGDNIAISPSGGFVYVITHETSNATVLRMYSRNPDTNQLTALTPATQALTAAPSNPDRIKISPDGKSLIVTGNGSEFNFLINTSTGLISSSVGFPSNILSPGDIAFSPDGNYLYIGSTYGGGYPCVNMYSRNTTTGALTALSPTYAGTGFTSSTSYVYGLAVSPDGNNLYATNYSTSANSIAMFSRDSASGILTLLSPNPTITTSGSNPKDIEISGDGKSVYVSNTASSRIGMFMRDLTTGRLTALSTPYISTGDTESIALSADGKNIYSSNYSSNNISMFDRNFGVPLGSYSKSITGLTSGTTYYYRGYATNGIGTNYSADGTFTTL